MTKLLVIDDDRELCELLREYFGEDGFETDYVHNGQDGVNRLFRDDTAGPYDLVILDIMLPGRNGIETLKEIRKRSDLPVVMLTARGDDVDRIVGLELGADDYICKPFNSRELAARIRAVLRRSARRELNITEDPAIDVLRAMDLELRKKSRSAYVQGKKVDLTEVEFRLLAMLVAAGGKPVMPEVLSPDVLGRPYSPAERSLSVHVCNIRRKLGRYAGGEERIRKMRNGGFLYVFPDSAPFDNTTPA